jgi:hypothetical protein
MKKLARSGVGLNSFIQRKVRNLFVKWSFLFSNENLLKWK